MSKLDGFVNTETPVAPFEHATFPPRELGFLLKQNVPGGVELVRDGIPFFLTNKELNDMLLQNSKENIDRT